MMRPNSVYCVECLCGHHIESETKTLICPGCNRLVVIEWPALEEHEAQSEESQFHKSAAA